MAAGGDAVDPVDRAELAAGLRAYAAADRKPVVVAGFDGFVDEMISVVGERAGLEDWTPMAGIGDFGDWVQRAAGRSALREIVVQRQDAGGCTVNLGDGLCALGAELHCYATLGDPPHPAFADFAAGCRSCRSWGTAHGRTLALEFQDGKLMLSAIAQLAEFTPELVADCLADGAYRASCAAADMIALTNWSLYPHMTACWERLQREVYADLPNRPGFFIDLVDPGGRSADDVRAMLAVLPGFEAGGGALTLGLNGAEADGVARALDLSESPEEPVAVRDQAVALRERLGIAEVVVHCVRFAAGADADGAAVVAGPYCERPLKSTGAGDRFNAGYVLGRFLGLPLAGRLALGTLASGFFVRRARSGTPAELAEFGAGP